VPLIPLALMLSGLLRYASLTALLVQMHNLARERILTAALIECQCHKMQVQVHILARERALTTVVFALLFRKLPTPCPLLRWGL